MTEISTHVIGEQSTGVTVWDKVNPMEFIREIGKVYAMTGAGGAETPMDGQLLALACLAKKQDVFTLMKRHHLMGGKLVVKAEAMLADFRKAGGKVRWIKTGTDGVEAELELTLGDVTASYAFNIATAQKAGYVKDKSQWAKRPDQMLRSRCITDLMRMQWPEICDGDYSEDEIADVLSDKVKPAKATQVASTAKQAEKPADRPAETATEQPPFDIGDSASVPDSDVIDASFEVVDGEVKTEPAKPNQEPSKQQAETMEIEILVGQLGHTSKTILEKYNAKNGTTYTDFSELSDEQRTALIGNLRKGVEAHQAAKNQSA